MNRTRLIRPSFFTDELMARLSVSTRLAYIGLWTLADDDGFFDRRPAEIGMALFGYEAPSRRLKRIEAALDDLVKADRIRWLECGDHGLIPTIPEHSAQGGRKTYAIRDKHHRECGLKLFSKRGTDDVRTRTDASGPGLGSGLGSGSGFGSGRGRARDLKEASEEAGGFVARLAAARTEKP
jgi:hypothetical protein